MIYIILTSYKFTFPLVPTPVQGLDLEVTSNQIMVSWMSPSMPNGVVNYNVTLSAVNLVNSQPPIVINQPSAVVTETMYTVNHISVPYSSYTVMVFASTSAGNSDTVTMTVVTPEAGIFYT